MKAFSRARQALSAEISNDSPPHRLSYRSLGFRRFCTVIISLFIPAIVPPAMTVAPKSRPTLLNEGLTLFGAHIHPLFVHTAVCTEHARTETQPTEKNAAQQQDPQRLPEANGFNPGMAGSNAFHRDMTSRPSTTNRTAPITMPLPIRWRPKPRP